MPPDHGRPIAYVYSVCGTHIRALRHMSRIIKCCMIHAEDYGIFFLTIEDGVDRTVTLASSDVREFSPERLRIMKTTHVCTRGTGDNAAAVCAAFEVGRLLASGTVKDVDRVILFCDDPHLSSEMSPYGVLVVSPQRMAEHDIWWTHRELSHTQALKVDEKKKFPGLDPWEFAHRSESVRVGTDPTRDLMDFEETAPDVSGLSEAPVEVPVECPELLADAPENSAGRQESWVNGNIDQEITEIPEIVTDAPEAISNSPEAPEVVANSPKVATKAPEVATNSSKVATNDPEVATKAPEVATEAPDCSADAVACARGDSAPEEICVATVVAEFFSPYDNDVSPRTAAERIKAAAEEVARVKERAALEESAAREESRRADEARAKAKAEEKADSARVVTEHVDYI